MFGEGARQQLGAGRCGHQRAGPGRPRRQVRQRLPRDGRRCPETPGTGGRREMCGCGGWHSPEGAGKRLSHWQGCSSCGLEVARERSAWPPQLASTAPNRLGTRFGNAIVPAQRPSSLEFVSQGKLQLRCGALMRCSITLATPRPSYHSTLCVFSPARKIFPRVTFPSWSFENNR